MQEEQHRRICKKQAAHKVHLLEVSGVLLVVLVQLLQPARGGARQRGSCRGRTSTSTSASVLRRRVGVAREYKGTTKGTLDVYF